MAKAKKEMKAILYLTNLNNGAREEDDYLVDLLKRDFEVIVSHPLECEKYLASADAVVIRNVWPTHEYHEGWKKVEQALKDSGLKTYNPLTGKGDLQGKDYLVRLYKEKYPVIPSVDRVEDIHLLPESEYYWVKPKDGCDGSGAGKYTRAELAGKDLKEYIIQPYVEFVSEPSFFFIDNKFSYAIVMPNRLADRDIKLYEPTEADLAFAQKFIDWNDQPYGIHRVDAVRTKDGSLLLTEVEDIAEYLYLFDIDAAKREEVVQALIKSITDNCLK